MSIRTAWLLLALIVVCWIALEVFVPITATPRSTLEAVSTNDTIGRG